LKTLYNKNLEKGKVKGSTSEKKRVGITGDKKNEWCEEGSRPGWHAKEKHGEGGSFVRSGTVKTS